MRSNRGVDQSKEAEREAIARLQRPQELWGRPSVALGLVLVWLALTGGVILLISGSGGNDSRGYRDPSTPRVQHLESKFPKPGGR